MSRNHEAEPAPACPVCAAPSAHARILTAPFLAGTLAEFVGVPPPSAVGLRDYTLRRCPRCTLEFADPMAPADDAFYAWLDREARYYVDDRWEWKRVEDRIRAAGIASPTVLEIGAGDGRFLRRLQASAGAQGVAIERSPSAVATLRERGVEAYTPSEAAEALTGRQFDFVLAFHCLEHIPDPVGLLATMRDHAGPRGRVLFSVPYSPMYFEGGWFDPLNHPPHHLTRWNARALAGLAQRCGETARFEMPAAYSTVRRARYALAIEQLGPHWARRRAWRWLPLAHPVGFMRELARQARRERVAGRAAADVVLVECVR